MMKLFDLMGGLVSFLNRLLALALGAFVLLFVITKVFEPYDILGYLRLYPNVAMGAGGALIALNLLPLLQSSFRGRGTSGYMLAPGGTSGPSKVRIQAVRKSLSATAADVPGVYRAKLQVQRLSPRYFRINVRYWIVEGDNAIAAGERLQLVLERRLGELVELDKRHRVKIDTALAGVIPTDKAGDFKPSSGNERGFRGPVYPVDADPDQGA